TRLLVRLIEYCQFFLFQAEAGIRDWSVTGVQTCALPIFASSSCRSMGARHRVVEQTRCLAPIDRHEEEAIAIARVELLEDHAGQIGRASCREREENSEGAV